MVFKKLGREVISLEEVRRNFTIPYMVFWNKYFPNLSKEKQCEMYEEAIHKVDKAKLYDNVKETLQKLHLKGIKMVVLSSDLYSTLIPEIKKGGVFEFFLEIKGEVHDKTGELKDIIKRNNFNPNETVHVGDTSGDVEAGKRACIKTIGITWGFQDGEILKQSNPDHLIHNIKKILDFT